MRKLISALFLVLNSCAVAGLIPWRETKPLLDISEGVKMYDFRLSFINREIEGLLLVTRNEESRPRLVLTSHFGISLFDLEGTADGYRVHYVIDFLDRDKALDLLWDDFLLPTAPSVVDATVQGLDAQGNVALVRTGSGIRKTVVRAGGYSRGFPDNIQISHPRLQLSFYINMTQDAQKSLLH